MKNTIDPLKLLALLCVFFLFQASSVHGVEGTGDGSFWNEWLPPQSPLNIQWGGEFEAEGIKIRKLHYTGSVWKGEPQRVYALYAHPEGSGPFPTILQIHGGGQTCFPNNVAYFVRHGYACLSFDWTGPLENRPDEEVTHWPEDFHRQYMDPEVHLPGQNLVHHATLAAIRGIDALCEQPEVDPNRIGVQGISWGGYITWLVGGLDPRVRASVPVYGVGGLEKQWSGFAGGLRARSEAFQNYWRSNYDPASFADKQHGAVMYLDATNDFFGQLAQAEERLSQVTVDHRRSYSPNRNHSLDPETVAAGMAWFDAHLKGNGDFPEEPRLTFGVSEGGLLAVAIEVDASRAVKGVRLDYARGGRQDLLKCWLSEEAVGSGSTTWVGKIPLVEAVQPLSVIPQVLYEEGFTLSGAVADFVPAVDFPKVVAEEKTSDTLSDWNNGPSGWFISRGTDFIHADTPSAMLRVGIVGGQEAMVYETNEEGGQVSLCTRLIADPGRQEGNDRVLEIWTHDLIDGELRIDWQTHQPGARSFRVSLSGGKGWQKELVSLADFEPITETPGEASTPRAPRLWNDIQRLDFIATPIRGGTPAIGLLRWVEP